MKAKDAKNIVDSAHPRPAQVDRLSEKEKKAMELAGTIEHTDGAERSELQRKAQELDEEK